MCVRGLDMQVIAYQAIPQVNPRIKEGHFISRPQSCKFDGGVLTGFFLEIYIKTLKAIFKIKEPFDHS